MGGERADVEGEKKGGEKKKGRRNLGFQKKDSVDIKISEILYVSRDTKMYVFCLMKSCLKGEISKAEDIKKRGDLLNKIYLIRTKKRLTLS